MVDGKYNEVALHAVGIFRMCTGFIIFANFVGNPGQIMLMVFSGAEGVVVISQMFRVSCTGRLTGDVLLICREHFHRDTVGVFGIQGCNRSRWFCQWLEGCLDVAKLSVCCFAGLKGIGRKFYCHGFILSYAKVSGSNIIVG